MQPRGIGGAIKPISQLGYAGAFRAQQHLQGLVALGGPEIIIHGPGLGGLRGHLGLRLGLTEAELLHA